MDPTPKSCAIAHTNAAEAKACVYACIFQDKHAHIYIYIYFTALSIISAFWLPFVTQRISDDPGDWLPQEQKETNESTRSSGDANQKAWHMHMTCYVCMCATICINIFTLTYIYIYIYISKHVLSNINPMHSFLKKLQAAVGLADSFDQVKAQGITRGRWAWATPKSCDVRCCIDTH